MKLSKNFDLAEFDHGAPIPAECLSIFVYLCELVLEPMRAFANAQFVVTSGYRSQQTNREAHGQPNSEHVASVDHCACDFACGGREREVFDWARQNATLPYHQLILEKGAGESHIIHVSVNRAKPGVRSVLVGATHNAAPYVAETFVPYVAPGEQSA